MNLLEALTKKRSRVNFTQINFVFTGFFGGLDVGRSSVETYLKPLCAGKGGFFMAARLAFEGDIQLPDLVIPGKERSTSFPLPNGKS